MKGKKSAENIIVHLLYSLGSILSEEWTKFNEFTEKHCGIIKEWKKINFNGTIKEKLYMFQYLEKNQEQEKLKKIYIKHHKNIENYKSS